MESRSTETSNSAKRKRGSAQPQQRRHFMKRIIAVIIVASGLTFAAQSALGHHSAAMFDNQKVKELTGTIQEFQWKNPHVWIQVYVQNGNGLTEKWSIQGTGP